MGMPAIACDELGEQVGLPDHQRPSPAPGAYHFRPGALTADRIRRGQPPSLFAFGRRLHPACNGCPRSMVSQTRAPPSHSSFLRWDRYPAVRPDVDAMCFAVARPADIKTSAEHRQAVKRSCVRQRRAVSVMARERARRNAAGLYSDAKRLNYESPVRVVGSRPPARARRSTAIGGEVPPASRPGQPNAARSPCREPSAEDSAGSASAKTPRK